MARGPEQRRNVENLARQMTRMEIGYGGRAGLKGWAKKKLGLDVDDAMAAELWEEAMHPEGPPIKISAAAHKLPGAVPVMDPFHVVRLARDGLDRCRQRVQQATLGHRGRAGDPLYKARRTLHTGDRLLTDKQRDRLDALFRSDEHVEVEATWGIYQRVIAAYREPDKIKGKAMMVAVTARVTSGVPAALIDIRRLGRTLKQRAADILAFFDCPGTSSGPTEAMNGRLEHLRGTALGFRNLSNYIVRSILEAGGFRPQLHPRS